MWMSIKHEGRRESAWQTTLVKQEEKICSLFQCVNLWPNTDWQRTFISPCLRDISTSVSLPFPWSPYISRTVRDSVSICPAFKTKRYIVDTGKGPGCSVDARDKQGHWKQCSFLSSPYSSHFLLRQYFPLESDVNKLCWFFRGSIFAELRQLSKMATGREPLAYPPL